MKSGIFLMFVGSVLASIEETVGTAGYRDGQADNKVQDDILKAMKDSGVLNEWKEKLDKQLFQEETTGGSGGGEIKKTRKSVITPQEREMLRSFVDEYKADSGLTADTKLVVGIVERVQKTVKPNLPQIFVQLGPIIEVISAISQKTKDVQKIIDRQAPVFDSPAKPKDVLHTLAENLKSELVRLTLDTPPKNKPARKKSTPPPPPAKKTNGLDMADYLSLGAQMMKGGNAAQMMKMLSGEADMASMLSMLPQLMEGGDIKNLLFKLASSYLESTPYGPMVLMYGRQAMESEQGAAFLDGAYGIFENFIKSENGIRFTKLVPELLAAKDTAAMMKILSKEAETNWGTFFEKMQNSDYKDSVLDGAAEYIVDAYHFVENPPKDSMFTKVPVILNGFLISQRLPALDLKNPVDSITKIANKCIALFTTWKLDLTPHVKAVSETLTQVYQKQAKGNKFASLSAREKRSLLARIMDEELVAPVQVVWSVFRHVAGAPQCQEHLLCLINHREFKNIKPLRAGESSATKLIITKGASLGVAYTLSNGDKNEYWRLYKAVHAGAQGSDCHTLYPPTNRECLLFSWQSKDFMNTQYDHVEL